MSTSEIPESVTELDYNSLLVMEKLLALREVRLDFALNHHRNTRDEAMEFENYPHIRQVYNSLAPVIVLQGSVQSFKSEWAVVDHFACSYVGLSVFFVVPKYESRTTYVQNRINKCVERVKRYKTIIGEGFFDSVSIKSFGKGTIKYVGANVLADFKEFPADVIFVEEVDECDHENVGYALDRLRASKYQFRRYLGNPKERNKGINEFFLISDQREWEVPCRNCGEFSEMDWFNTVVEAVYDSDGNVVTYQLRDVDWTEGCGRDVHIVCPHCKGALNRTSSEGRWIAKCPEHAVEGYHISMLCSPINSIAGMWNRFKKAIHDPTRLQQFYNSDLGLPFSAAGNKITEGLLTKCIDPDLNFLIGTNEAHIPEDSHKGPCTMGVDVGGNLDVRISYVTGLGVRQAVYIGKISDWQILYELIDRYHVEKCVIDSMPETTLAVDFQHEAALLHECDVWLCRYAGEGKDKKTVYDGINRIINIDRTAALDRSFAALKGRKNLLPVNFSAILAGQFADEMCDPVRQMTDDKKGNTRYEWSKCKDHQRHADAYDLMAATIQVQSAIGDIYIG